MNQTGPALNSDFSELDTEVLPAEEECYDKLGPEAQEEFHIFERNLGGYAICGVGLIGIFGNLINLGVLSHKEMRGNCFNQLLIGK